MQRCNLRLVALWAVRPLGRALKLHGSAPTHVTLTRMMPAIGLPLVGCAFGGHDS